MHRDLCPGVRQLVNEAFEIKHVHRASRGAPESHRNMAVEGMNVIMANRNIIRKLVQSTYSLFGNQVLVRTGRDID